MNLPLWIPALALVAWGWEMRLPGLALPMAVLILAPYVVPHRFPLTRTEFHRAWDICWVLAFGGLLLIYNREAVGNVLRNVVQWLPVVSFPALLAQAWSTSGKTPSSALLPLPFWRRREGEASPLVDLGSAYVAFCVLSASASGGGRPWFYAGLVAVIGAMLWARRARGTRAWSAALLFALAAVAGWFIALGLAGFQQWVENGMIEWTSRFQRGLDPNKESRTAIGRTGRVGNSSRIILRLRDEGGRPLPHLLRVATFTDWGIGTWYASRGDFEKVEGSIDQWELVRGTGTGPSGMMYAEWVRASTRGLVPLPGSTRAIRDFNAESVERTAVGAVRADVRAGVVSFRAQHSNGVSWDREPTVEESTTNAIPSLERKMILAVARSLDLTNGVSALEARRVLAQYFQTQFEYSTDLVDTPSTNALATTSLGHFLLGHRRGHCEYFATAAVLLLRAAGLPARYATGFRVDPNERAGEMLVVRETEAHAWVRIWSDGRWEDFDPTPSIDFEDPAGANTWTQRLARRWHELRFEMARWWWLAEKRLLRQAYWLAVPLLAGLLWHFRRLRTAEGARDARKPSEAKTWPGMDSEWLAVEARLITRGWERRHRESQATWRERLQTAGWESTPIGHALDASRLHDRLRFDPRGLSPHERQDLRRLAEDVLGQIARTPD